MDDDELVRAARDGVSYAGPFLVSWYGPKLAGYCRSVAQDLSDTDREHAIANGIERAVRRIEKYEPDRGPLLAWLRPFVLHATQDWRRDNARLEALDASNEPATQTAYPITVASPVIEAVRAAFRHLSAPDQIIIVLRDYEQRSVEATANILSITQEACRQRHHRARRRLRVLLAKDERARHLTGESP